MASAAYSISLDAKRNAFASGAVELNNYTLEASWQNGMMESYQDFAPTAAGQFVLNNAGGEFSPETLGAELLANGSFTAWTGDNPDNWSSVVGEAAGRYISQTGEDGEAGTGAATMRGSYALTQMDIYQDILTVGRTYRVELALTKPGNGIRILDNITAVSPAFVTGGNHVWYFTAASTRFGLQTDGPVSSNTLASVSVKESSLYGPYLSRGTLIRVRMTWGAYTNTVMYTGKISSVLPSVGVFGEKRVTVMTQDLAWEMLDTEYVPPLKQSVSAGTAIADIFDNAIVAWPYRHNYWMLGVDGASQLGYTTILYTHTAFEDGAGGDTTFAYTGDVSDYAGKKDPQNFIRDLVAGEQGRFYFNTRASQFTLVPRSVDVQDTTSGRTFTEADIDQQATDYIYGDDLVNECAVTFVPRKIGTAGTVIYTANDVPFAIYGGGTGKPYHITAPYYDATAPMAQVGAMDGIIPQAGVDYSATLTQTGQRDLTSYVNINVEWGANAAELTIYHSFTLFDGAVWIQNLQLRGTPITVAEQQTVTARNHQSQYLYERKNESIYIQAIDDYDLAQSIADYRVGRFGTPIARFRSITFNANKTDTRMENAIAYATPVANRITLTLPNVPHSADYFVVGEQHRVIGGGDITHDVTLILKPADRETFWILGTAGFTELGETTRLFF